METFAVFETSSFSERLESLEKREQEWIEKMKQQISTNPLAGKPLGSKWFREKKFENKRLYFFAHPQKQRVLLISFGSKKEQAKIIGHILSNKNECWKLLEEL